MRNVFSVDLGLLLLRLAAGILLLVSGLRKSSWLGLDGASDYVAGLAVPFAEHIGTALPFVEIIGGALLVLGLLTRLAAAVMMLLAGAGAYLLLDAGPVFVNVHGWNEPFLLLLGNPLEFMILYAVLSLALVFTGPGAFSVDAPAWRSIRRR
ncbi:MULTISPECIES: DoxX family membrane protein [Nesterenkonia]|uniref:Putative oxidoreductase n=1 Tax=Nesterenkonia xinjiangensis TaxID=225327 RepID=A0A7Z0GM97_9MICC|nr:MULTISPECIES: DoxX family membrane protein [Nesterenkonia]MDZ5077633.1 DoxX family membrane protein [Nesterenkonia sp. HG001]NYJ78584.1 putative oxidoreductase [Nesterenkonia xinjiangensis]